MVKGCSPPRDSLPSNQFVIKQLPLSSTSTSSSSAAASLHAGINPSPFVRRHNAVLNLILLFFRHFHTPAETVFPKERKGLAIRLPIKSQQGVPPYSRGGKKKCLAINQAGEIYRNTYKWGSERKGPELQHWWDLYLWVLQELCDDK